MGDSPREEDKTHPDSEAVGIANCSADSTGDAVVNIDHVPAAQSDASLSPQELPAAEPVNQSDQSGTELQSGDGDDEAGPKSQMWSEYSAMNKGWRGFKIYTPPRDLEVSVWSPATFPYHHELEKMRFCHPEVNVIGDFFFNGQFRLYEINTPPKNVLHLVQIPHSGEAQSSEFNCVSRDHVRKLQSELSAIDKSSQTALQLVIVPDISPAILELLGHQLQIDHRVFVNHLWTHDGQPFDIPNACAYDLNACLDPPPNTVTIDCDINVSSYSDTSVAKQERDEHLDYLRRWIWDGKKFLRPSMTQWPAWLACPLYTHPPSYHCYGTSRITIHHLLAPNSTPTILLLFSPSNDITLNWNKSRPPYISDRGNPFLRIPGQGSFQFSSDYSDVSTLFYESRSEPSDFYQISLLWVSRKVVAGFSQLVQNDMRRLVYFREQRIQRENAKGAETTEQSYNPPRDLRILQDKVYDKLKMIQRLRIQFEPWLKSSKAVPDADKGERSKQDCNRTSVLRDFDQLEKRMHEFLVLIKREMDDTITDLQRELTLLQLEESRKSIEQNDQVRKLTILAFFFIPISAVSSIFGMNVQELQLPQHQPRIWVFVVVVCCITAASVTLAISGFIRNVLTGIVVVANEQFEDELFKDGQERPKWFKFFIFLRRLVFLLVLPFRLLILFLNYRSNKGKAPRREKKMTRQNRWYSWDNEVLKLIWWERSPKNLLRWLVGSGPNDNT